MNRDYSEKALKLLSQTTFTNGIANGVSNKIVVAHKYGERGIYDGQGNLTGYELHDCGIMYLPNKPMLLCVMTQGKDFNNLEKIIQQIANMVSHS